MTGYRLSIYGKTGEAHIVCDETGKITEEFGEIKVDWDKMHEALEILKEVYKDGSN